MTKVIALQKSFPDMLSLTDLEMAITRPYDDARVDDAGDWEEICKIKRNIILKIKIGWYQNRERFWYRFFALHNE